MSAGGIDSPRPGLVLYHCLILSQANKAIRSKTQPMKLSLLDTNLTRLKALLSVALTTATNSIDKEVKARFPEFSLLFSASEAQI